MIPLIIGITGGSASGKTTIAKAIAQSIKGSIIFSMDCFYSDLPPNQDPKEYNFDHPDAIDFQKCCAALLDLKQGKPTKVPKYDFTLNKAVGEEIIEPSQIIIVEGIFSLYYSEIRDMLDIKIYVHTDDDIRLARRLQRDIIERGRTIDGGLNQYNRFVKPCQRTFINPCMKYADVIFPNDKNNSVALEILLKSIQYKYKAYKEEEIILSQRIALPDQSKAKELLCVLSKILSNDEMMPVYCHYACSQLLSLFGKNAKFQLLADISSIKDIEDIKDDVIIVEYLGNSEKNELEKLPWRANVGVVIAESNCLSGWVKMDVSPLYSIPQKIKVSSNAIEELKKVMKGLIG